MSALGYFITSVVIFLFVSSVSDEALTVYTEVDDTAIFEIQEGQSVTIGDGKLKFYNEEKDKTFIYDFGSGEIIDEREGK